MHKITQHTEPSREQEKRWKLLYLLLFGKKFVPINLERSVDLITPGSRLERIAKYHEKEVADTTNTLNHWSDTC